MLREIALFNSVGMAIEDVATATFAYQQALAVGLGTRLDLDGASLPGMPASVPHLVVPHH